MCTTAECVWVGFGSRASTPLLWPVAYDTNFVEYHWLTHIIDCYQLLLFQILFSISAVCVMQTLQSISHQLNRRTDQYQHKCVSHLFALPFFPTGTDRSSYEPFDSCCYLSFIAAGCAKLSVVKRALASLNSTFNWQIHRWSGYSADRWFSQASHVPTITFISWIRREAKNKKRLFVIFGIEFAVIVWLNASIWCRFDDITQYFQYFDTSIFSGSEPSEYGGTKAKTFIFAHFMFVSLQLLHWRWFYEFPLNYVYTQFELISPQFSI